MRVRTTATCAPIITLALLPLAGCASINLLVAADSNECINVPWHGFQVDGTQVVLLYCRGHRNQYWTIANGQITGVGGACLDVQGSAPVDGAGVVYVTCNGSPSQQWTVANGQIVGIGAKCLDILQSNKADRAPLIITTCSGAPSQQWQLH